MWSEAPVRAFPQPATPAAPSTTRQSCRSGTQHDEVMDPARRSETSGRTDAPATVFGWGEVLTVVPYHLGYQPRESLVIIALRPESDAGSADRMKFGGLARVDLFSHGAGDPVASIIDRFAELGFDRFVRIDYQDLEPSDRSGRPAHAMRTALPAPDAVGSAHTGVAKGTIVASLVVRHGRWASRARPGASPGGREPLVWNDLPRQRDVAAVAELVYLGMAVLESRAAFERVTDGTGIDAPGDPEVLAALGGSAGSAAVPTERRDRAWRLLLADPSGCAAAELALAASSLLDVEYRDALLWRWFPTWPGGSTEPPQRGFRGTESDRRVAAEVSRGDLMALLGRLAALPVGLRVPMSTVIALVAWSRGWGTVASTAIEVARRLDPGYRLGRLTERLIGLLVPPPVGR